MIGWGIFGGLLPEIIRIIKNRENPKFPDFYKHWMFWLGVLFHAGLGGVLVYLLIRSGKELTELDALVYGYVAPSIIASLAAKIGETKKKDTDKTILQTSDQKEDSFELRKWWGMYTTNFLVKDDGEEVSYSITPTDPGMKMRSLIIGGQFAPSKSLKGNIQNVDVNGGSSDLYLSVEEGIDNTAFSITATKEDGKKFTRKGRTKTEGSGIIDENDVTYS